MSASERDGSAEPVSAGERDDRVGFVVRDGVTPGVVPGEVIPAEGSIETLPGAPRVELAVHNGGDRPVQVGSHFHFAQANSALEFDRAAAHGHRLDIAVGTAVLFDPGFQRTVSHVPLAGARVVPGMTWECGLG